jgi:hypothetical protein
MGCSERFGHSQSMQKTGALTTIIYPHKVLFDHALVLILLCEVFDLLNRGTRATKGSLIGQNDLENRYVYTLCIFIRLWSI